MTPTSTPPTPQASPARKAETTHFVPLPGRPSGLSKRTALCGARVVPGPSDWLRERGYEGGSSRLEYVDCSACLRLAALVSEAA